MTSSETAFNDEELIKRLRKARKKQDEFEAVMLSDTAADRIEKLVATNERLEAAIRELKRCWYQGDLTENDFAAALKGADHD